MGCPPLAADLRHCHPVSLLPSPCLARDNLLPASSSSSFSLLLLIFNLFSPPISSLKLSCSLISLSPRGPPALTIPDYYEARSTCLVCSFHCHLPSSAGFPRGEVETGILDLVVCWGRALQGNLSGSKGSKKYRKEDGLRCGFRKGLASV